MSARDHGLGRIGVWSGELRNGDRGARREAVSELDALGFGAVCVPGGVGGDILDVVRDFVGATQRLSIVTSIINIWKHEPAEIGAWQRQLSHAHQARILLGLGVSHGPIIGAAYAKPMDAMNRFLDGLDARGVARERRAIAALGPRMLQLSKERSAGALPYLVTPEHTAQARAQLGPDTLIAVGQAVVLQTAPDLARAAARRGLAIYLNFPNYLTSWKRLGITDEDIATVSDRLCDALVAWGDMDAIRTRVQAHLDAGADHVSIKVMGGPLDGEAEALRPAWRELAAALL
jgi:probable F420-dependent oxidoreductase